MSSRGTTTSSLAQRYCCLSRDPHPLCSMLNEIAWLASVAEKSFTGIETSPKETVNDAMDRGAMLPSQVRQVERLSTPSRSCLRVRASRQRSPVSARRSAALEILKSSGCALESSSHVIGIDTGAPAAPLGE